MPWNFSKTLTLPCQIAELSNWFGHDYKIGAEGEADAHQNDVTQLPGGRLHDGRVFVAQEDDEDPQGEADSQAGQRHASNRFRLTPVDEVHWDIFAFWTKENVFLWNGIMLFFCLLPPPPIIWMQLT